MSIWSWSLLQFCIVPTTFKELPDADDLINPEEMDAERPCSSETKQDKVRKEKKPQDAHGYEEMNGNSVVNNTKTSIKRDDQEKNDKSKKADAVSNDKNSKKNKSVTKIGKNKSGTKSN